MINSDSVRFIRWALPGWIAVLSFIIFIAADILTGPGFDVPLLAEINKLSLVSQGFSGIVGVLLVAGAGFPLGFIIYQFYFFMRWTSPFSRDGFMPPFIESRMMDLQRALRDISLTTLALGESWRHEWVQHPAFKEDHRFQWRYIEGLLTETLDTNHDIESAKVLYDRHGYLMDIMHLLGASIGAVYLGFLGYIVFKAHTQPFLVSLHLFFLGSVLALLMSFMNSEREGTRRREDHLRTNDNGSENEISLSFLMLFFCYVVFLLADPNIILEPQSIFGSEQLLSRSLVIGTFILLWCWRAGRVKIPKIVLAAIAASMVAFLARAAQANLQHPIRFLEWSFVLPALIFLTLHAVLLKNRQNADDNIVYLEYYMLKRFLARRHSINLSKTD